MVTLFKASLLLFFIIRPAWQEADDRFLMVGRDPLVWLVRLTYVGRCLSCKGSGSHTTNRRYLRQQKILVFFFLIGKNGGVS